MQVEMRLIGVQISTKPTYEGVYSTSKVQRQIPPNLSHGLVFESDMRVTQAVVVRGFSCVGTVTAVYVRSSLRKIPPDAKSLSRSPARAARR